MYVCVVLVNHLFLLGGTGSRLFFLLKVKNFGQDIKIAWAFGVMSEMGIKEGVQLGIV